VPLNAPKRSPEQLELVAEVNRAWLRSVDLGAEDTGQPSGENPALHLKSVSSRRPRIGQLDGRAAP